MDPPLALSIAFRRGWQWPFREGDTLRVYAPDGDLLAELPARFVLELVHHSLVGHALQAALVTHFTPAPAPLATVPGPGPDREGRAAAAGREGATAARSRPLAPHRDTHRVGRCESYRSCSTSSSSSGSIARTYRVQAQCLELAARCRAAVKR
jgi:hypothetical protein